MTVISKQVPRIDLDALGRYPTSYVPIPLNKHSAIRDFGGKPRKVGKAPRDKKWTTRCYEREEVLEAARAGHNVGIRLEATDLVVDIDPRSGGDVSWDQFVADHDLADEVGKWPKVVTGSGGEHFYLRKPADIAIRDSLGDEYPGLEFKSSGRQVVAAGCVHPKTKKLYAWDDTHPPIEVGAPDAPQALLDRIRKPERDTAAVGGGHVSQSDLAAYLDCLDPREFRDPAKFLQIMMACHHATAGAGRYEFTDWSTSDPKFHDHAGRIARRWDSLDAEREGGVTVRTLGFFLGQVGKAHVMKAEPVPEDEFPDDLPPEDDFDFETLSDDPVSGARQIAGLTVWKASDVVMEPIEWLWPGRVARGEINFIAGHPGQGKSQITCAIAAAVSKGAIWPNCEGTAPLGSVVMLSAEDNRSTTVVPRLVAAGADRYKIDILGATVRSRDSQSARMFSLADDLQRLTELAKHIPDVRLVVIDPISAYMGSGKGAADTFKNSDVRAVLAPLAEWAGKHRIAVIFVSHLNKSGKGTALGRLTDSLAFGALARCGWMVAPEMDDNGIPTGRKLFVLAKNNLAEDKGGLAYRISSRTVQEGIPPAPFVEWDGPVSITADEALDPSPAKPLGKLDAAQEYLEKQLAEGPRAVRDIEEQAGERGIALATLRRAKHLLGIQPMRSGFGPGSLSMWALPDPEIDDDFG